MRDHDEDPEVIADLRARAASEYDRSRARETISMLDTSPIVTRWPCRARCGSVVDITAEVIERVEIFDRALAARDEPPIDRTRAVFCEACRVKGRELQGANNRKQVDHMAALIRRLKESRDPANEHAILEQLRTKHGATDSYLRELVAAINEKATTTTGAKFKPRHGR